MQHRIAFTFMIQQHHTVNSCNVCDLPESLDDGKSVMLILYLFIWFFAP